MSLGGRVTGHAVGGYKVRHLRWGNFFAQRGQPRDDSIIQLWYVATPGWLGDFWVVQLRSILIDLGEAQPQACERRTDQVLEDRLLRRARGHRVASQRIEAQARRATIIRAHHNGDGGEDVF